MGSSEEEAMAPILGYSWLRPTAFCIQNATEEDIKKGRMWSEVPSWFPRDIQKLASLLGPMSKNGYAFERALENLYYKEEDFIAKIVMLLGSDFHPLCHPLRLRFAYHLWEHKDNKINSREGLSLVSFFPSQPEGTLCQKEFNQMFGVCDKEGMNIWNSYHPVLVIDPGRTRGSFMRLSVKRFEKALPRGSVRVVVSENERGPESDFE
ncbi:hypothetical protein PMAYCL1PPCAC_28991, partial [Pristionchus mayeri]